MTPYEIQMLIEIYVGPQDPSANPAAPLFRETYDKFFFHGLIEQDQSARGYGATERARVYINALCDTPWPVQKWVMPTEPCNDELPCDHNLQSNCHTLRAVIDDGPAGFSCVVCKAVWRAGQRSAP